MKGRKNEKCIECASVNAARKIDLKQELDHAVAGQIGLAKPSSLQSSMRCSTRAVAAGDTARAISLVRLVPGRVPPVLGATPQPVKRCKSLDPPQ
jgi:hypothetical protein